MNLNELVRMRNFTLTNKVKLVRHQDPNYDTKLLHKIGMLEFYQSIQSNDVFGNCDYILSFLGEEGRKAIFIGAYQKITSEMYNIEKHGAPQGYPYMDILSQPLFYYEFQKIDLLGDMIDRLVIDWSTRGWHQWIDSGLPKQVIEILPSGYVKEFPGFDNLILNYDELATIIKNPDPNRVWHNMLKSVAGVYLIVDLTNGSQYVGSASGEEGILGRWKTYVDSQHGGNARLMELLSLEPDRYKHFQFSILSALPRTLTKTQVISHEQKYKQKLGSRAFGLNAN